MRRSSQITKADVTRAIKAVLAAGLSVARVTVKLDSIIVVPVGSEVNPGMSSMDEDPDNVAKLI